MLSHALAQDTKAFMIRCREEEDPNAVVTEGYPHTKRARYASSHDGGDDDDDDEEMRRLQDGSLAAGLADYSSPFERAFDQATRRNLLDDETPMATTVRPGGTGAYMYPSASPSPPPPSGDTIPDLRVENLQVANEQGEPIGAYVAPERYTLDQAYHDAVTSRERPVTMFEDDVRRFLRSALAEIDVYPEQPTGSSVRDARVRNATSSALSRLQERFGVIADQCGANAERRDSCGDRDGGGGGAATGPILSDGATLADGHMDYLMDKWQEQLATARVEPNQFFSRMCPLCGFSNNTQDAIDARDFDMVQSFGEPGIWRIDDNTHAILLSLLWNALVYEPMRRRHKRILPLTVVMASDHLTRPHRWTPEFEGVRECRRLTKNAEILWGTAYKSGPTGGLMCDLKRVDQATKLSRTKLGWVTFLDRIYERKLTRREKGSHIDHELPLQKVNLHKR